MSMTPTDKIDWTLLPEHLREGVAAYILYGRPTGGFLAAVIRGDRADATARADPTNARRLDDIFLFFEEQAPPDCHGSPANMTAWMRRRARRP